MKVLLGLGLIIILLGWAGAVASDTTTEPAWQTIPDTNFQPASGRVYKPEWMIRRDAERERRREGEREVPVYPERDPGQVRIVPRERIKRIIIYRDRPVFNQTINNYSRDPNTRQRIYDYSAWVERNRNK